MAITAESAKDHAKDPAVLCCRVEAGTVLAPANLEDPVLFPDLEDSGLLEIPSNHLTIGQVLGAKLTKTLDALAPLTPDVVDGVLTVEEDQAKESQKTDTASPSLVKAQAVPVPLANTSVLGQVLKLSIEEGKGINLEIPLSPFGGASPATFVQGESMEGHTNTIAQEVGENKGQARKIRSLLQKHFVIKKVIFANETKIEGTTLFIRRPELICSDAVKQEELVEHMKVEIITPDRYGTFSETIMDVQPIATKEEGDLGEGITRVLDGVVILLTGTDANGVQIGEFGSSEGELDRNIMWGRPGAPDKGDILIKIETTIKAGANMERPGPLAAHKAADFVTEEIRQALKKVEESLAESTNEIVQFRRKGNKKVVLIKEVMGQGAMHDNLILPMEPVGVVGAKPNVDLGNLPIMLSPTEVLDGGIHALTCIGPASKECSRHYFREPLVLEAMEDEEIDLVGVIFVGSPQANSEKFYVSKRLGMMIEAMEIDGAIVTTEGFGNNHIDFAAHIEEIGKRDVNVVGVTYSAVQGALVVGNKYMDAMIDCNKSMQGIENEILANNTLCKEDAIRALAMLKTKMAGGQIKTAERKWVPDVKTNNIKAIEGTTGKKITCVDNEQVLPKSKKRLELYEKE